MALVACKECGKQISRSAEMCPHCGHKPKRTSFLTKVIGGFFALAVLMAVIGSIGGNAESTPPAPPPTPEQSAAQAQARAQAEAEKAKREGAVAKAAIGANILKKNMRNPDAFKLESALVIDTSGAVCYDYRAQNGFGGMNVGHAVLAGEGQKIKFLSSDEDGFANLWNRECANKRGEEVVRRIRL